MSLLFAHLEHQIRRTVVSVGRVIVEKCTGFSDPTGRQLSADEPCDWQRDLSSVPAEAAEDHRGYYEGTTTCGQEIGPTVVPDGTWHGCYRDPSHTDLSREDDLHVCLCGLTWCTGQAREVPRTWSEWLIAREAEEEVAEPRSTADVPAESAVTYSIGECFRLLDESRKTSAVPPTAEDDPAASTSQPAAGSPTTVPAGLRSEGTSPAGLSTPGEFAAVAVREVLAEHYFWRANHSSIGSEAHCACGDRPHDQFEWREHVAAEVARRIDAATNSQLPQ